MTPQEYKAAKERLGLNHPELAALLDVHPVTSRDWATKQKPPPHIAVLLKLVEHVGVDEARRILKKVQETS